jgi:hypothetical protein
MNKSGIKVEMTMADYDEIIGDRDHWLSEYNELRRLVLKYYRFRNGMYYWDGTQEPPLEDALLEYLNSEART